MGTYSFRGDDNNAVKNGSAETSDKGSQLTSASNALREDHNRSVCSGPGAVEKVNENNFSKLALAAFGTIDVNRDGILEKGELEHSLKDNGKVPCASLDAMRTMLNNFDVVKSFEGLDYPPVRHNEYDRRQPGISKEDLLKFDKIRHGDGFYGGYAKDSISNWALGTATIGSVPAALGGAGIGFTYIGNGVVACAIGMSGGLAAAAAVGAGIGAGINYYSYKHNHVPKIRTFLDDINAGDRLRSKI